MTVQCSAEYLMALLLSILESFEQCKDHRLDQSITFCIIIFNMDQWIRCCVKSPDILIYSSGGHLV